MLNHISAPKGVWFGAGNVCVSGVVDVLPKQYVTGFAKAMKTFPAAKRYWRPLNSKRSLPVLKWTSESEYFFSEFQKKKFADTIY